MPPPAPRPGLGKFCSHLQTRCVMSVHAIGLDGRRAVDIDGPCMAVAKHERGEEPPLIRVTARRGHQVLLPKGAAYQATSTQPGVIILQTMDGPVTVKRWSEICTLGDA